MKGDRKVQAYLDAEQEKRVMERQKLADPTCVMRPVWLRDYNEAKVRANETRARLTGGELGRATRILKTWEDSRNA